MTQKCIALLGKQDEPTDAVEEYCRYLSEGLRAHDFELCVERVRWAELGWPGALEELRKQAREWCGTWVFVQYTALAWSARGFPLRYLRVLEILQRTGARIGVVFHDVEPYAGRRWVDALRRRAQLQVMREALRMAELAVVTVPVAKISWMERAAAKAVFIPVGANLPLPENAWEKKPEDAGRVPTIAVFGVTGGPAGVWELASISETLHFVAERLGKVRVTVLGRNAELAEKTLGRLRKDGKIEVCVRGVVRAEEVVEILREADVFLFVRGAISTRRGSAIAGIACGLPVVAMSGPETAAPITEGGVVFADAERQNSFGEKVLQILTDEECREELSKRSQQAQEKYFSWKAIAGQYAEALRRMS